MIIIGLLILFSIILWLLQIEFTSIYLTKAFYTVLSLLIIYVVIKIFFEQMIARKIKEPKTRYSMKRVASMLSIVTFITAGIAIWVDNIQALLVSYGILAAGAAVALQDVFRNFAGSLAIFITGTYHIGDRIEVNSKIGDVVDIGIFYTTLLETNEWVDGDQATGRLSVIPNSVVLSSVINNYTKDHPYIWDEISIPITYDSDWGKALQIIEKVIDTETKEITLNSEASISKLSDKYYLPQKSTEPTVFATLTDNWINMNIRYITEVRQRRILKDRLNRILLSELAKVDNITIASESINVSIKGLDDRKITQNNSKDS
ncbi:MAG: mechanosensitive ion channel [Dehalococcoidales bacterium]|nr:mechanosensitive ion channel [Dehalococcoidales bacterium]